MLMILMFPLAASAQLTLSSPTANFQFTPPTLQSPALLLSLPSGFLTLENTTSHLLSNPLSSALYTPFTTPEQPRAYCFKELALFCKIEVQLEQLSKIPVKFRLGSVDYVDQLESKR
ncbi:MAG: hypothetical protein AB8G15_22260 [Saprospiraceae bacterium]